MKCFLCVGLIFAIIPSLIAAEPPGVQDIIFEGPKRPIHLRLQILVDGKPYADAYQHTWDRYLKALFAHLDRDGDGFLSEIEGQRMPAPSSHVAGSTGRSTNVAFNFRVVDANGDGKLDFNEVAAFYREYGSTGLAVNFTPKSDPISSQVGRVLFDRLDRNKDGKLSREELQVAGAQMGLDADEDELLSPAETVTRVLASGGAIPLPATRIRQAASQFLFPGWNISPEVVAQRLSEKYDAKVNFTLVRPDIELLIRLGDGEKPIEVARKSDASIHVSSTEFGFTLFLSDCNTLLEFHVNEGRPRLPDRWRQRILDRFAAAGNGSLTLRDARIHDFFPQQFDLLDRDLDGKLTRKELIAYLDQLQEKQAAAVTSVVSVQVSDEGQGLFDLLDRNRDGKLSLWELRNAARLLAQLGNQPALGADDLPHSFHIALGLCQSSFNRSGGFDAFAPSGLPMLTLDWSDPKLVWFHKMDRNRDGYVSRHEFLGSSEIFNKLDADGDELISPDEALRAPRK